ncbi:MAG TPA: hypothetical protein VGM03_08995, partial [Phycisphaerae bacterium]
WTLDGCAGTNHPSAPPTANDDVVICSGKTAQVTDTSAVARTVTNNGTAIEVTPPSSTQDATLTLGSGSTNLSSYMGTTKLMNAGSGSSHKATLALVSITHTFESGTVRGFADLAEINIAASIALINKDSIRGQLTITSGSGGNFDNQGTVWGDVSGGTILIKPYELTDNDLANWSTINGGKLKFDSSINTVNSLEGNFFMLAGSGVNEIQINKAITTSGLLSLDNGNLKVNENFTAGSSGHPLDFHGGTIDVAAGKLFTHY